MESGILFVLRNRHLPHKHNEHKPAQKNRYFSVKLCAVIKFEFLDKQVKEKNILNKHKYLHSKANTFPFMFGYIFVL